MQDLTAWLNSKRNFKEGVQIYLKYGDNKQFVQLLLDGETQYTSTNLFENLKQIYYDLKYGREQSDPVAQKQTEEVNLNIENESEIIVTDADQKPVTEAATVNVVEKGALYDACKNKADKYYKELMNVRALLFTLCDVDDPQLDDAPDLIPQREKLALQIMDLQTQADKAYADLHYVEQYGALPMQQETREESLPTNPIQLLTYKKNLVSGINKLKNKEQTPERVALLEKKLKQLELANGEISRLSDN